MEYLEKLKFAGKKFVDITEVQSIDDLKISEGKVAIEKDEYILPFVEPDLRYYWKNYCFGLHISDCQFNTTHWKNFIQNNPDIKFQIEVLYLSRTKISKLDLEDFTNLKFLYISENDVLESIHLTNLNLLETIEASHCPVLNQVAFTGSFNGLGKINLSFCKLRSLNFDIEVLPSIDYLNIQYNQLEELNIQKMSFIRYLFLQGNPITTIHWPQNFFNISIIQIDEIESFDPALLDILRKTDDELSSGLESFLKLKSQKKEVLKIRRLKLLFIGNTTVGKSTLRKKIFPSQGDENDNYTTHGVKIFSEDYVIGNEHFFIQGFDFGGQDYYHATHLPFLDEKSLNVLVYGYLKDEIRSSMDTIVIKESSAYSFNIQKVKSNDQDVIGRDEVVYPITYWLGTVKHLLKQNERNELSKAMLPEEEKKMGSVNSSQNDHHEISDKVRYKIELIQNIRVADKFQELDNRSIKTDQDYEISGMNAFNFEDKKEETELTKWKACILEKHATIPQDFFELDKQLGEWLQSMYGAIYLDELYPRQTAYYYNEEKELVEAMKRLESHNLLSEVKFDQAKEKNEPARKPFYITNYETFSNWIHNYVLTRHIITNKGTNSSSQLKEGHFTRQEIIQKFTAAKKSPNAEGSLTTVDIHSDIQKIIDFLEYYNIIFKIKNHTHVDQLVDSIDANKIGINNDNNDEIWVAPAYLPSPQTRVEELFLGSFNEADCKFEFTGFFHSNIILMIIDLFDENLVLDADNKEFLLWKNKVVLYQQGRNAEHQTNNQKNDKAFLLIELKYPGDKDYHGELDKLPQLSISRNVSGFVKDSIFEKVFKFILEELKPFNPDIVVKTRYNDYIPYECLFQNNKVGDKSRSNLIFHNETIYSRADFRHFGEGGLREPTKIFIAYSRHDLAFVEELRLHLKPYENQGDVVVFYDKDLAIGEKWDEETKHQLTTSDIVVFMVSPYMLSTDIVVDIELPLAHNSGRTIVPIILSPCRWQYEKLNGKENLLKENNAYAKAQPLPSDKYEREAEWEIIAANLANKAPLSRTKQIQSEEIKLRTEATKIFIVYAESEFEYVNELLVHCKPFENQHEIKVYYKNKPAEITQVEETPITMNDCDVVVFMVSPELLATDSIINELLPWAHKEGKITVPIILKPCNWDYDNLNGNNNLLKENNAYGKAKLLPADRYDREAEWMILAKQLASMSVNTKKEIRNNGMNEV